MASEIGLAGMKHFPCRPIASELIARKTVYADLVDQREEEYGIVLLGGRRCRNKILD
jgi:hypothetical protein